MLPDEEVDPHPAVSRPLLVKLTRVEELTP
jgi:hypothetical protein